MDVKPLTIELDIGHTDRKAVTHTKVTFGNRLNGKKLFDIDSDPQSALPTQYQDLLLRAAITEFGEIKIPVPLKVLLELDSLDREDLNAAFNKFSTESLGDRASEQVADNEVKLAIGLDKNGLVYNVVRFGTRLTGMMEVEADRLKLSDVTRRCFLAGKQVVSFSQSEGSSVLDGPITIEIFEQLDMIDVYAIVAASEVWRNSFRRPGARVPEERRSANSVAADARTRPTGS